MFCLCIKAKRVKKPTKGKVKKVFGKKSGEGSKEEPLSPSSIPDINLKIGEKAHHKTSKKRRHRARKKKCASTKNFKISRGTYNSRGSMQNKSFGVTRRRKAPSSTTDESHSSHSSCREFNTLKCYASSNGVSKSREEEVELKNSALEGKQSVISGDKELHTSQIENLSYLSNESGSEEDEVSHSSISE